MIEIVINDSNEDQRVEELKEMVKGTRLEGKTDYLIEIGYLTKPASIKFHGSHKGGLYDHSKEVARLLEEYTNKLGLKWQQSDSPIIVGLLHDLCKLENYTETEKGFEWNKSSIYNGHGDLSVIISSQLISLTKEEIACIRWHMGSFDNKENWEYYTKAIKAYPNVLFTHTADMEATHIQRK